MWWLILICLGGLVAVVCLLVLLGKGLWWRANDRFVRALLAQTKAPDPAAYDAACLADLPAPVRRYFQTVLRPGQPLIRTLRLRQHGLFRLENKPQWKPFEAAQLVTTVPPAFNWNARIHLAPGMTVHVRDAYQRGRGYLVAALWGLIRVAQAPDTAETAQGELLRFLAESPWYPTALLPGPGLAWTAVDDHRATVRLTDGDVAVALEITFDSEGLIASVFSPTRPRSVAGAAVPTPWRGTFSHYERRNDMLVPTRAEVAWLPPEGPMPYWQGRIDNITVA